VKPNAQHLKHSAISNFTIRMPNKKTTTKKIIAKKEGVKPKSERYFEAVGRRKTSTVRVRVYPGSSQEVLINGKSLADYFPGQELQQTVLSAFKVTDHLGKFRVSAKVRGGGVTSQAEAVRHGIARALVLFNKDLRKSLKRAGFLTRDPRMRERKKFGLKRARRAPQWKKR